MERAFGGSDADGGGAVACSPTRETEKDVKICRLKRELARVSEERDNQKKATASFARDAR